MLRWCEEKYQRLMFKLLHNQITDRKKRCIYFYTGLQN